MRTVTYATWEERQQLCAEAAAAGETLLHGEIRIVRRKPMSTLVFDLPPPPTPPSPPTGHELRHAKIAELLDIGRTNWTTVQMREVVELVAQEHPY
jgi:hypothetical protein